MTDESDKTSKALKLVSTKLDLSHITKDFTASRLATFDSPAMRAIDEQSKRWAELMAPSIGQITASQAAISASVEMLKVGRIAADAAEQFNAIGSLSKRLKLEFPDVGLLAKHYTELFRNPMQGEFERIASAVQLATTVNLHTPYQSYFDELRRVVEGIHTPWVNSENALASVQGLAGLTSISKALREPSHPFEKMATHLLRDQLGDWRHAHSSTVIDNPIQRSDFYLHQGLNSNLTNYPTDAFDEALTATGIQPIEIKPVISSYQLFSEVEPDIDEPPTHMVAAYKIIYAFESRIRRFIDEIMTERYGPSWAKHRVPGDMKKDWEEKRTKALDSGEPERPLICYADFTHYEAVIVRKDNWEEVFKAVFRNKESVTESLRRLYPMRVPTMHTRIIISDDMLYLMAETRRLLTAIENYYSKGRAN